MCTTSSVIGLKQTTSPIKTIDATPLSISVGTISSVFYNGTFDSSAAVGIYNIPIGANTYNVTMTITDGAIYGRTISLNCVKPQYTVPYDINTVVGNDNIRVYFKSDSQQNPLTYFNISMDASVKKCYTLSQVQRVNPRTYYRDVDDYVVVVSVPYGSGVTNCDYSVPPGINMALADTSNGSFSMILPTILASETAYLLDPTSLTYNLPPFLSSLPYFSTKVAVTFSVPYQSMVVGFGSSPSSSYPSELATSDPSKGISYTQFLPVADYVNGASLTLAMLNKKLYNATRLGYLGMTVRQFPDPNAAISSATTSTLPTETTLKYSAANLTSDYSIVMADRPLQPISPPYPFGLFGNLRNATMNIQYLVTDNYVRYSNESVQIMSGGQNISNPFTLPTGLILDNEPPVLMGVSFTLLHSNQYAMNVIAYDQASGVYSVVCGFENFEFKFGEADMYKNASKELWMQKVVSFQGKKTTNVNLSALQCTVRDMAGNMVIVYAGASLPYGLFPFPSFDMQWTPSDITHFEFKSNKVDVTNVAIDNTLFFNITNPHITQSIRPILKILSYRTLKSIEALSFTGFYNPAIQMFQIDFTIPMNIYPGPLEYSLDAIPDLTSTDLRSIHPNATLTITSSYIDLTPPMILMNGYGYSEKNDYRLEVGWSLTVIDKVNGLKMAIVNISSDLDDNFAPYSMVLTPTSDNAYFGSGDDKIGNYIINITIPRCVNQVIRMTAFTQDKAFNFGMSPNAQSTSNDYYLDPLSANQFELVIECNMTAQVDIVPQTLSLSSSLNYDVGNTSAVYTLNIPLDPATIANVSRHHIPRVFVSTMLDEYVSFPMTFTSTSVAVNFTLPYGFGHSGNRFYTSMYGLTSFSQYSRGFSIQNTARLFTKVPELYGHLPLPRNGGLLVVLGRQVDGFDLVCNINGANVTTINGTIGKINLPYTMTATLPATFICVARNSTTSTNRFTVSTTPVPTFEVPNPSVSCSPACTANGVCVGVNVCECSQGWSGPTCASQVVIVNPSLNDTSPTTTVEDATVIRSIINIVSIREVDLTGNPIQTFTFDRWNLTISNITSYGRGGAFNRTIYTYRSPLANQSSTLVDVTIENFDRAIDVAYAGQILKMQPGTIKYSITISKYNFASTVNSLQVLVSVDISSKQDSSCASVTTGETGVNSLDAQWIKLQVNGRSVYGRFIQQGVIDNRVTRVQNKIQPSTGPTKSSNASTLVAIQVPFYTQQAYLDPDFSSLIDTQDNSAKCGSSSSGGLTTPQLIGIIVAAAVVGVVISIIFATIIKKKYRFVKQGNKIELVNRN